MKAPTSKERFSCARKLLDYGFSNYKYETLANENDFVKEVYVQKGTKDKVNLVYDRSVGKMTKKNETDNIDTVVEIKEEVIAPVNKGEVIGKVKFVRGDETIGEVNLIAEAEVRKQGFGNMVIEVYKKWFNLMR